MNNVLFLKKNQMRFEKFRERERERLVKIKSVFVKIKNK